MGNGESKRERERTTRGSQSLSQVEDCGTKIESELFLKIQMIHVAAVLLNFHSVEKNIIEKDK